MTVIDINSRRTDRERVDIALRSAVDSLITTECCTGCTASSAPVGTYAGYHMQDIERAFSTEPGGRPVGDEPLDPSEWMPEYPDSFDEAVHLVGDLYITFGIQDEDDAMPRLDEEYDAVGARIVDALNEAGFITEWTGSANQKVGIVGIGTRRLA